MLTRFAKDIWTLDGEALTVMGFDYPTRCTVIRLEDNTLVVISPTGLNGQTQAQIGALGPVTHLIAPNMFHHMFLTDWQKAYPNASLFGLAGLQAKRPDLRIDGLLDDGPIENWGQQIDHVVLHNKLTAEVVFFHRASQTVIFTDIIQQFPRGFHKGWRGVIARLDLMVGSAPNVPRKFRLGFRGQRDARSAVAQILNWPIERVLMAHGQPVTKDGQAVLKRTFAWMIG